MKNFKEIAEKCLAGELSGIFILQDGSKVKSTQLRKLPPTTSPICSYGLNECYISDNGNAYGDTGYLYSIKKFIPNNKQEQIKIDIPEGKIPVMEQTEKGVVITWKEKAVTYAEIYEYLCKNGKVIHYITNPEENTIENLFIKKVNVLRKLTNIRNYFGQPDGTKCGHYIYVTDKGEFKVAPTAFPGIYTNSVVAFKEKEHAEQAIKMLGDELKYLFEPW